MNQQDESEPTVSFTDDEAGIYFRRRTANGGFELVLLEGDKREIYEAMIAALAARDFGERVEDWVPQYFAPESGGTAG